MLRISGIILLIFTITYMGIIYSTEWPDFTWANYFSYFTVLSNISLLIYFSAALISDHSHPGFYKRVIAFRPGILTYLFITTAGFWLLLGGYMGTENRLVIACSWFVHGFSFVWALADMLVKPQPTKVASKNLLAYLIYPMAYLGYTFARAALNDWYPYPFLNPDSFPTKTAFTIFILAFLIIGFLLMLFFRWLENFYARQSGNFKQGQKQ